MITYLSRVSKRETKNKKGKEKQIALDESGTKEKSKHIPRGNKPRSKQPVKPN